MSYPYDLSVLVIDEGRAVAVRGEADHPVFPRGLEVGKHLGRLVPAEPPRIDFLDLALVQELFDCPVDLLLQIGPALGKGEGIPVGPQDLPQVSHAGGVVHDVPGNGLIHEEAGDLPGFDGRCLIGEAVEVLGEGFGHIFF